MIITQLFNDILYRPLFNALVWFYNIVPGHDLGVAIIILTLLIRFILYPLSKKSIRSQKALSKLQPEIKEINNKYKNNKEEQVKQMMALYKKHQVNPISGCLPILIQLPILIALYRVFFTGLDPSKLDGLYSFIERPAALNPIFLNLIDLSKANIPLAVLAGVLMFVQSKMMMTGNLNSSQSIKIGGMDIGSIMNQQMVYIMPIMTVLIAWKLPAALALYWVVITLFGIVQQYYTKV